MASLKDIAEASGFSIRTVSRVLKDNGYAGEETRKAVLKAAGELGYRPNRFARSLKTQKGYEVIVLAWSFDELHMAKIAGLENELRNSDYSVSIVFEDYISNKKQASKLVDEVAHRNPAGVVILPGAPMKDALLAKHFSEKNIPYCFMDSREPKVDSVSIDRQQGVYESILYLAANGRKQIAYLGPNDPTRLDGYNRATEQLGIEPIVIHANEHEMNIAELAKEIFSDKNHPDAIQAFSDKMAMLFIGGVHEMGIRIPDDLAVVGFDNRYGAEYFWPALTTVAQPNTKVGQLAAEMITRKIAGQTPPLGGWSTSVPTELIKRNSA